MQNTSNELFPHKSIRKIKGNNERENHGKGCKQIKWPNSLKTVPSGVANCHNLPFSGRATRDSWVHLPREENARSRHQHLFEENVRKKTQVGLRILRNKGSRVVYVQGRCQHPTRLSQGTTAFNQMCKIMTSNLFYFPFFMFYLFRVNKSGDLAPTYPQLR